MSRSAAPAVLVGYRLVPDRIEFWRRHPDRLHEREVYAAKPAVGKITLLAP